MCHKPAWRKHERHEGKDQFLYCVKCLSIYTLSDFGVLSNLLFRYLGLFSNIYFLAIGQCMILKTERKWRA